MRKKVAILNIYQGMIERGAEILIDQVATRLSKDFEVTIFSGGKNSGKNYQPIQVAGVKSLSPDVSGSIWQRVLHKFFLDFYSLQVFLFTLKCIPKLFKRKLNIIISINGFWQMILLRLLKIFTRTKIVSTGFAGIGKDSYWNAKLTSDGFIAMTKAAAKWVKNINPKIKIFAIGGGVDLKRFTPKGERAKINLEQPIILCVSALVPYKRVDLAIQAVAKLPKGSLVIIGDGSEKEYLKNLGQELLGVRRFKILKIPYTEIAKYYRASDVFTLPSESSEAFGIVYLEAMASGVPVVAPRDDVRREIVNGGGILVDVENIGEYAKALEKTFEKKWGNLPRIQAAKFSWNEICKKYKIALESI